MLYSSLFFRKKKNFIPIHCKLYTINFFTHVVHWSQINKKFTHKPCESEMHVFFSNLILGFKREKSTAFIYFFLPHQKKDDGWHFSRFTLICFICNTQHVCVRIFFYISFTVVHRVFSTHKKKTDSIGQSLVISFVGDWTQLLQAFHT